MRVLIFSWRGPKHPNVGGAEISTHEHAKYLVKMGHQVTLFTSWYSGAKKQEILDGVNIIRRGFYAFGVQLEAFKWYMLSPHQDFDLVIDQFHGIPFFTPLYIKKKKLGFIHEVAKEVWRLNPWPKPFNIIPAFIGILFEPLIFKIIYKNIPFMTVSQSTKKDLVRWGINKNQITVIHNGLNVPKTKILKKNAIKTIIFLGALTKDKGIEDTLYIFEILQKHYEKAIQFWVVGKGDPKYENFLKHKSINLNIKFFGFVSEEKKFDLLSKAHILINTSIREGWGLVVIEAAAVGTPTVAFNVPGLKDSIDNSVTGFLTDSPEDLTEKIIMLLDNQKKYEEFRKNCIVKSKKYSWEKSGNLSLELIKRIVKNGSLQK